MEADRFVLAVEKYLQEFVRFLLSFFSGRDSAVESDPLYETANKTMVFAVLSAALGVYFWNRYILGVVENPKDFGGNLVDTILRWVSFGILLQIILRFRSKGK